MAITTSFSGVLEATFTVALTTLEDCVWLVPLVAQASSSTVGILHGLVFVATFLALSIATCIVALVLQEGVAQYVEETDILFEAFGAALCWVIGGYFYWKAYTKRRARKLARAQREPPMSIKLIGDSEEQTYGSVPAGPSSHSGTHNNALLAHAPDSNLTEESRDYVDDSSGEVDSYGADSITPFQPWTIISLTIAGSLDEISYFPGLIVGQIFTPVELCLGTLFASLLILALVDLLVRRFAGCLTILDKVPLHGVIFAFAILLTVDVLWDLMDEKAR
jgi:hypothetical protein